MRARRFSLLLVVLFAFFVACESSSEGDSGGDIVVGGGEDVMTFPPGTGPAAACSGVNAGVFLAGSAYNSPSDDSFRLEVSSYIATLDLAAEFGDETGLMVYVSPGSAQPLISFEGDGTEMTIPQVPVADGMTSGQVFDRDGFGGEIIQGRLCFDALPVVGQPASGGYVFLVTLGEERILHRVQGSFEVPGEAVVRADTLEGRLTAVKIDAGMGATVSME